MEEDLKRCFEAGKHAPMSPLGVARGSSCFQAPGWSKEGDVEAKRHIFAQRNDKFIFLLLALILLNHVDS